MTSGIPIKKLFKTALYTSVLIGAIAIASFAFNKSVTLIWFSKGLLFHTLFIFFIWLINISLVYLIESFRFKKFAISARYILSYVICVSLIIVTRLLLQPFSSDEEKSTKHFLAIFVLVGFALNTIVLIIQDLILLRDKKTIVEIENAQLKIKNVEAINQQLKQQIHPHFLFNSLNTLKTLIKKHPDKAEDYLIMLSDFLRASISTDTPNIVKLKDEIKLCLDYLEMFC